MKSNIIRDKSFMGRLIVLIAFVLILFPSNLFCVLDKTGLDGSWRYMINAAHDMGLTFGGEIVYTYGPLGFVCYALNIGNNLVVTALFFGLLYIYLLKNVINFVFDEKSKLRHIVPVAVFVFFAFATMRDIIQFAQQKENYILFVILVVFTNIFFGKDRNCNFVFNSFLMAFAFLSKFTLLLAMIPAQLFLILGFWQKKEKNNVFKAFGSIMLGLAMGVVGYLLYSPSLDGLITYVTGAKEISGGYAAAMQLVHNTQIYAIIPFVFLVLLGIEALFLLFERRTLGWYFLIVDSMLFMAYKHAFVRGLNYTFYSFFFFGLAVIVLNYKEMSAVIVKGRRFQKIVICFLVLTSTILIINGCSFLKSMEDLYMISKTNCKEGINSLEVVMPEEFESEIPKDIVETIGTETVSIYGDWIIDGYMDSLNMKHYPSYQVYCAYTPRLDNMNAKFFCNEDAPEKVLIWWAQKGIDGRVFLIDTPAMYEAILSHYTFEKISGDYVLLDKNEKEKSISSKKKGLELRIEENEDVLIISDLKNKNKIYIDFDYTLLGWLRNIFFAVPTVNIRLYKTDGSVVEGRVVQDNLRNGLDLKSIPSSVEQFVNIFEGKYQSEVEKVEIYGDGIKYYNIKAFE